MITEAMLIKGLTAIGVLTITKTVLVPAAKTVGTQIGKTIGIMSSMNGSNLKKKAGGKQETNEAAILELMKECDKELKEDKSENEPDNNQIIVIENIKPEPAFSEKTQEWIRKCQSRYGGFEDVILN